MATRNRTYFLVEMLEYLQKGGRIGAAKTLLGSPLQVNLANGEVGVVESQRTSKKAMQCFLERIEREYPRGAQAHLNIMHGGVLSGHANWHQKSGKTWAFLKSPNKICPLPFWFMAGRAS